MTIAKKLILLICVALFSLLFLGVSSINELKSSQKRFEVVQTVVIPSILILNESSSQSAQVRAAVRDYIIGGFLNDQNMKKVQAANLENLKSQIIKNLETYEKTFVTDAIREQAAGMNGIAVQIEKIAQMAEESSAAADSSADTAKELDRLAKETKTIINSYQL